MVKFILTDDELQDEAIGVVARRLTRGELDALSGKIREEIESTLEYGMSDWIAELTDESPPEEVRS